MDNFLSKEIIAQPQYICYGSFNNWRNTFDILC